jgi:hypothetical protein
LPFLAFQIMQLAAVLLGIDRSHHKQLLALGARIVFVCLERHRVDNTHRAAAYGLRSSPLVLDELDVADLLESVELALPPLVWAFEQGPPLRRRDGG